MEAALGDMLTVRWLSAKGKEGNPWSPDAVAEVRGGRKRLRLALAVISSGEPKDIAEIAAYARLADNKDFDYAVLAAPFVGERGRELCKTFGLGYVDLQGNAYLKLDGVLIDRTGRGNATKERRVLKKLFGRKATWMFRKMLTEPGRKWGFANLADSANVSLGMAYKVVDRLVAEGYVQKEKLAIRLTKPSDLLDAWAKIYDFSSQRATGYYCPLKDQEKILAALRKLPGEAYALTLGAAASMVAPAVRSTDVYIYASGGQETIVKALDLKPVEFGGNVYLVEPNDEGILFDTQRKDGLTLVSSLQLYLDLFNYPSRGREQAEAIREKALGV